MVAVKGMMMPKSCMECLLFDDEYGDCNVMGEPKADMTEERAGNCPLVKDVVERSKIEDAIPISEGATNGDVIKAMFPDVECGKDELGNVFIISSVQLGTIAFRESWWNAPYKVVIE